MAQTSPAKIKITALHQVGLPVKDLKKTMKDYWNILGIGPHVILTIEAPHAYALTYGGKPANYKFKASFAQVGPVEFEMMQSIEGHTIYDDFIKERGEGANHLQYWVDSVEEMDKHVEIMAKQGYPLLMGGRFGSNGGYAYIDTVSALKTIWEPVKMPDEPYGGPAANYPSNESEVSPAKIRVKAITQIGIVVKNLEKVMGNYWNILGIGPWDVLECVPPAFHDITYHGKPVNSKWRVAFTNVGSVQLELLQPVSGLNLYSDFIREKGEGIHHIQYQVDDIKETNRIMEKEGFPVLMGGGLLDGGFAYYDTVGPLKIIWEAFQPPKVMPPMLCYP
jgi:catechol 2,3-dioxygenase-like lactoylglutathione lyase family enzyme